MVSWMSVRWASSEVTLGSRAWVHQETFHVMRRRGTSKEDVEEEGEEIEEKLEEDEELEFGEDSTIEGPQRIS